MKKSNPIFVHSLFCVCMIVWCYRANADDQFSKDFGRYSVLYNTFNSLMIDPEIAKVHGLVRAKDQTLINISVQDTTTGKSIGAKVSMQAKNLIQQVKEVTFKEILEPGAVYYIGSLKHTDREVFHLIFSIQVAGEASPFTFILDKELYTEQ